MIIGSWHALSEQHGDGIERIDSRLYHLLDFAS